MKKKELTGASKIGGLFGDAYNQGYRKGVEDALELVEGEYEELADVIRRALLEKSR